MSSFFRSASLAIVGALFLFCLGVWGVVYAETPHHSGELTFAMLDVGQGDALYIESPTGVQVLVDGGPDDSLLRSLGAVMPALDRSIDVMVATHPDADHIGGFVALLERYEVALFVSPGITKDTATAKKLEASVDELGVPRVLARRGMVLELGGGARLEILYPDRDVSGVPGERANEAGIVARLVYGSTGVLLMADVGKGVETRLLQLDGAALDSDILKVGHHGSRYSTGAAFVQAVSPEVAVISVGAKNSYGHPTAEALAVLKNAGAQILRTDQKGTIRCVSDGAVYFCDAN